MFIRNQREFYMNTNVLDAAFHTAHDFPGGVPALAHRMGKVSPNVLNKKVDPRLESHHLRLDESVKMQAISGDFRILQAMAFSLNHVAIQMIDMEDCSDMAILDGFFDLMDAEGKFAATFKKAWADGSISKDDLDAIKAKSAEVQGRLAMIVARTAEMAERSE